MFAFPRILLLLGWGLLAAGAAFAGGSNRVGAYDFAYLLGGDAPARPVQVFDDGRDTFLQFRNGAQVPAIFAMAAGVPQLLLPLPDGPYLRVPQLHGRLLLQFGAAQATAIHARGERADAPPLTRVGAAGNRQPVAERPEYNATRMLVSLPPRSARGMQEAAEDQRSYARPLAGDSVQWEPWREPVEHAVDFVRGSQLLSREARQVLSGIVQRAAPGARFVVIGRDDDSYKEHLEQARAEVLRDALRRAGVAPERIALRTGAMRAGSRAGSWESTVVVETAEPVRAPTKTAAPVTVTVPAAAPTAAASERPTSGFTLGVADRTISGAVRRWAQALGYQLVWDAPEQLDAPITGAATLPGDSLQAALELLLRGLQAQGYRLEVTLHANRVIRFTPAAQPRPAGEPPAPEPARDTARPLLRAGASSTP